MLSVREESQTWDEGIEIASGYSYLKTGDYRIAPEHPPFARIIAALPICERSPLLDSGGGLGIFVLGRSFCTVAESQVIEISNAILCGDPIASEPCEEMQA